MAIFSLKSDSVRRWQNEATFMSFSHRKGERGLYYSLGSLLRPTTRQTRDRRSFPSAAACFIREEAALAAFTTLRARPELVEARAGSQQHYCICCLYVKCELKVFLKMRFEAKTIFRVLPCPISFLPSLLTCHSM